ncbi:MAG: glycosyltransferase [Jatrophihabitans sp.]|uniref:glycosyltransferase n=1 Tax=Jatrophihabitans sp. TaxID=1932789 RepID=UPI003F81874B
MQPRPTLLFAGTIGRVPRQGGAAWAVLQYLLGFRALGWDVWFVEPAPVAAADEVARVLEPFGFAGRWAVIDADGTTAGAERGDVLAAARRADLLVNVAGMLTDRAILDRVPVRVYLDLDPAFVQLWHAVEGVDMRFAAHTDFVTLSDSVGRTIPACGIEWVPLLPPVVLAQWPWADTLRHDAFTTVGHWRAYGSIHADGVHYGQKAHALRPLLDLPSRVGKQLTPALAIHPDETADLAALHAHGWQLLDPDTVAAGPQQYRDFVAGSFAEFGVAKTGYVVSDSGWFSDRSAAYLASGRPVVTSATGFERRLPAGKGLLSFTDLDSAAGAIEAVTDEYADHRHAARALAETHLDAGVVLTGLLNRVLA